MLSPALSVEETGLMAYLQTPPDAGPSVVQVTSGLQKWKCAGRRLVEIGGRLPTATQLHQSFIKILTKHLASNKKVNFVFQQKSSTIPVMNPSPTEIVELFSFVTLIQYATVAGRFPGVTASSVKTKPKKANKDEVPPEEPTKGEPQVNATTPTTPRPKPKGQAAKETSQSSPKAAPRGGITASMIVLEPDDLDHGIVLSAAQALDNDQCYAMVDSGTNAIMVPLHPGV